MCTNLQSCRSLRSLLVHLYCRSKCRNGEPRIKNRPLFTSHDLQKCAVRFKHDDQRDGRGSDKFDNILNTTNSQYLDNLYQSWRKDPKSVGPSWDSFFKFLYQDTPPQTETLKSSSIRVQSSSPIVPENLTGPRQSAHGFPQQSSRSKTDGDIQGDQYISGALDINATIRAYQARGHLIADIDPLGIQNPESRKLQGTPNLPPAIVVREHLKGMTDADMNREFPLAPFTVIGGRKRSLPLRDILIRLNEVYCGHLGLEYTYIHDLVSLDWLRHRFEAPGAWQLPEEHRRFIWKNIMRAVTFEGFLARKFPTEKRFGLEGCEAFIPSMVQFLESSAEHGVETAVIGMAHRGRLNTLINVCGKPLSQLLTQFHPIPLEGFGSADVKYHLGTHAERLLEK